MVSKNIIIVTCFEEPASLKFCNPYKNEKRGEAGQKQLLKQDSYSYKFRRSVCRVKIKKKIKTYEEKEISAIFCRSNYMPLMWASIHCE